MSLLNQIEKNWNLIFNHNGIRDLQHKYGRDLKLFKRRTDDVHTSVYGNVSGETTDTFEEICGVIVGDDEFFPSDMGYSGSFKEGFLYTTFQDKVGIGDVVEPIGSDGKARQYEVKECQNIGRTQEAFTRFKLCSIGN